jgi:hypothetical protein
MKTDWDKILSYIVIAILVALFIYLMVSGKGFE